MPGERVDIGSLHQTRPDLGVGNPRYWAHLDPGTGASGRPTITRGAGLPLGTLSQHPQQERSGPAGLAVAVVVGTVS